MLSRPGCSLLVLALGAVMAAPGLAQQTTSDDLKSEIGVLQRTVQALRNDIQEIKAMLAGRPASTASPSPVGTEIDISHGRVRGDRTAKLTLIEFSDYQCGFCARYVRQTYPQLEAEYIKTGKVRVIWLDMPIESIHKSALKAAEAARCAGEQDKYWEMHDRLFAKQEAFEPWTAHAEAVGLDLPKFNACLESGKFVASIRANAAEAQKAGVAGTPAFMLARTDPNGSKPRVLAFLMGAQPFEVFKTQIDALLAEPAQVSATARHP